ncbi:MAG: flippase-like domain-containing protein [Clostridia bacterium]|nr:flippase-like domain-containing protein [Clostridia bacterium]
MLPFDPEKGDIITEEGQSQIPNACKRGWKKVASLLLFAALVVLLGAYIADHWEDMGKLFVVSGRSAALLLTLALGGCLTNCIYHLMILRTYGVPLSLTDWMGVVSVSNAISYVLPLRADLVFSAAYYKRVKGLQYTKSASMAAGNIVFGVAFFLLQMLVALLCIGLLEGQWQPVLWILWALGLAAVALLIVFPLLFQGKAPTLFRKWKMLAGVIVGFNALLRNRRLLFQLLLCLVVNNAFQLLLYLACFQTAGLPITLYGILFCNSVSWLSSIITLVPGNLGIKESGLGVIMLLIGEPFQNGVSVSLLQRVAVMMIHLLMGLVFALPVYRRFSSEKNR